MADRKSGGSKEVPRTTRTGAPAKTSGVASNRAARRALRRDGSWVQPRLVLGRTNYLILAAGAVAIILGFLLLASRDITLAPILLVLGYCFLIPAGLLWRAMPRISPGSGRDASGE